MGRVEGRELCSSLCSSRVSTRVCDSVGSGD